MTDDELRKTYGIAGCGIPHEYTELHVRGLCAVAAAALREADKRPELAELMVEYQSGVN